MNLESIIDNIPQNLSQMEKARYIYINLCKQVSYDPKYLIADSPEEKQELFDEDVQLENWTKNRVICSTISKLYVELLERAGISSKTIHREGNYLGHMFVSFECDGKNYYADPTHDILWTKKGFKTHCFGTEPYEDEKEVAKNGSKFAKYNFLPISQEELKRIDDLLGYTYQGIYMEDFINLLKREMQEINFDEPIRKENESNEDFNKRITEYNKRMEKYRQIFDTEHIDKEKLMEYKIKFVIKVFDSSNLEAMDKSNYFEEMLRACATQEEMAKMGYSTLKCTENSEDLRIFSVFTNKETGERMIYTFSNEDFGVKVDEEYISQRILSGMTTVSNSKEKKDFLTGLAEKKPALTVLLEQLKNEYNRILLRYPTSTIDNALKVLEDSRTRVHSVQDKNVKFDTDNLDEETKNIFQLMADYKNKIQQLFINKNESIRHITSVSPENMKDGKISKSNNRADNYEIERGDWVFASSTPIDGSNAYIARKSGCGMIRLNEDTYVYGGDSMQVSQDREGNNHVILKESNYVYEINPENFTPVVTLKKDTDGEPSFEFSEEWISEQEVDINNPQQVRSVEEISDITNLLKNYQVLCDVNMTGEARKIMSSGSREKGLQILREGIKAGRLRYINAEADINVNEEYKEIGKNGLEDVSNSDFRMSWLDKATKYVKEKYKELKEKITGTKEESKEIGE